MMSCVVAVGRAEAELIVDRSKFIGIGLGVSTVDSGFRFIQGVRSAYTDASHHCYAFAIGCGSSVTHGMSDDGEPHGSAGHPMLSSLKCSSVRDIVVVVTRYFGGRLLGKGGLIKAYTKTTQLVLEAMRVEEKIDYVDFKITIPYETYYPCKNRLIQLGARINRELFEDKVISFVTIDVNNINALRSTLADISSGAAEIDLF